MGDATNLVLILAGELLKRAEGLLVMGLHPSEIIQGYEMAVQKGRKELEGEFDKVAIELRDMADGIESVMIATR